MPYVIRLRIFGGKTKNGDGGVECAKGADETMFFFSTSSLSFNGTTVTRGQIPYVMYYCNSTDASKSTSAMLDNNSRKAGLTMATSIIQQSCKLLALAREKADEVPVIDVLNNACIVRTLLPMVLAHMSLLASDPHVSLVKTQTVVLYILVYIAHILLFISVEIVLYFSLYYLFCRMVAALFEIYLYYTVRLFIV